MKTKTARCMVFLLLAPAGYARVLNVPADYSTIQAAINASVNHDTILVAPGTYHENVAFKGRNIVLTSRFVFNADPSYITSTIIDGSTPAFSDTGSCVRIVSGEDTTAVLQGFTLTGGYGTLWADEHGPGRYWEGGGIIIAFSNPTIKHNIIRNNNVNRTGGSSTGGAGIRLGDCSPRILDNIIVHNAGMYGGGIVSNYASPVIRNNIIAFNTVSQAVGSLPTYGGGGIWVNGAVAGNRIENNTIVGNSATGTGGSNTGGTGGGILAAFSATIDTRNNIVWGNTQTTGPQVGAGPGSSANVSYSDVEGGFAGVGNMNLNPQFADTSFYLLVTSPCVDAGDTSAVFNDPPNPSNPSLAQWPSLGGVRNDCGAYGGPLRAVLGSILTSVPERTGDTAPVAFSLGRNYPNPFNPTTRISFTIAKPEFVVLTVFDMLGREVRKLVNDNMAPGTYAMQFDGEGLSSGVYYYRLTGGTFTATRQMLLLK